MRTAPARRRGLQNTTSFQPQGHSCARSGPWSRDLGRPGGRGIAFKTGAKRQAWTVLVVWDAAYPTPWVLLTDLLPAPIGVCWYGLLVWIAWGFRVLKGGG